VVRAAIQDILKLTLRLLNTVFQEVMKHSFIRLLVSGFVLTGLFSCSSPSGRMPEAGAPPSRATDHARSQMMEEPAARKAERPGLATGWGDEKRSYITGRSFLRTSSKPAGTDAIYYNNKQGVDAMAGSKQRVEGLQTAAGSLVEWGIKGGIGFLPTYKTGGNGRRLVAGQSNSPYTIFVRNRSKSALEIVASVDGLDVMDGKPASFSKKGYIVEPGASLEIDGFRTSYSTVAAFKFSSVANSYANMRHGDTRNVGVIGLAVFTQKGVNPWTWMPDEVQGRYNARPFAEAP
jgi:hypothetical protein